MNKPDIYQEKAIKNNSKNILLIAAAGSGKTFTIIKKIEYLINYYNIKPAEILVISFTNKSVDDLKRKINFNVNIFTFHKLATDILKYNNITYQILNDNYLEYIIDEYFQGIIDNNLKKEILKYYDIYNYNTFLNSNYFQQLKKNLESLINLYKTNNNDFSLLPLNNLLLTTLFINIYNLYTSELKSTNFFDFDDLIIEATKYVNNYKTFKYIIIDEFQDTSTIRWNLIYKIHLNNNAFIFVVGDDYQSIFKFSGSSLDLFLNFTKTITNSEIMYLKYTYRNSQELINIAGKFITKNHNQIKKELLSNKHLKQPIKLIYYFNGKKAIENLIDKLKDKYKDILILGRNNFDINSFLDEIYMQKNNIRYLTVHSSKGLEADVVIIINLTNNIYGFPNKLLKDKENNILYAEERRLFYVALTRTKNEVYLLTPFFGKSSFVKELRSIGLT